MSDVKAKGWTNQYQVANSHSLKCGQMKCVRCKGDIVGDYLIRDRRNFLHRGKETDERFLFHRGCFPSHPKWKEHKTQQALMGEFKIERDKAMVTVKLLINEWGFSQDELFG